MFYSLLEQVLNEAVADADKIVSAMDNHSKVIVTYKPVTPGREHATGPRLIGIFAYGTTKSGNPCVRVYEYAGDTATFVPGWKLLRLDQLKSWKKTGQIFTEPPDEKFNPNGDNTMANVFKITSFGDEGLTKDDEKGPRTAQDLYKTDTEKDIERRGQRLKAQFDNPITISDFKAQQGLKDYANAEQEYTEGPKTANDVKTEPEKPDNFISYKDEVGNRFKDLRDRIKNAPKINLDTKPKTQTSEPEEPNTQPNIEQPQQEPTYKDEVRKQFEPLRDKIKNAQKIDLSQYEKEKELRNLRKKLGDTNKPMKLHELKKRLGMMV